MSPRSGATLGDDAVDLVDLGAIFGDGLRWWSSEGRWATGEEHEAVVVDLESADVEHGMN